MSPCDFTDLNEAGLNLQAVIDFAQLPPATAGEIRRHCDPQGNYRQLILIGHAGKTLWESVQASGIESSDPIDDYTAHTVRHWFATQFPGIAHALAYPGDAPLGLQSLGQIAGWHQPSPFMIGINAEWGSWYAYRAVLLTATDLEPTAPLQSPSPCGSCQDRPCVSSCPGKALEGKFSLDRCVAYRLSPDSRCQHTCIARVSCPVGSEHRYTAEQLRHSYCRSLQAIRDYY